MKTKNKVLAVVEIAVMLCSLFLVALPTIAAEQTSQVSASTITTTSEDDFVLGVYGNANEDDTIDMRDLTYVKLIFFGKKSETELADAKYDGKINPLDFIQIKLIIVGKEKEITIVDAEGAAKTVSKPVEGIIVLNPDCAQAIRTIGAKDEIIGIEWATATKTIFFPELSQLPSVGMGYMPDLEKILAMNPDILIAYAPGVYNPGHEGLEDKLEPTVTVVRLDFYKLETIRGEMLKLGYLLDKVDNARKYLEWHDKYIDKIEAEISGLSDNEKPKVFLDYGGKKGTSDQRITCAKGTGNHQMCEKAGGRNIAINLPPGLAPGYPYVSLEWVLEQNPEVIIGYASGYNTREGGYETDDDSKMKEYYDEIRGLPGFENIEAVRNNRVYILHHSVSCGPSYLVGLSYLAKWFHPELFSDLDPQKVHQEYIDEFCGIDFDVKEHGVFIYQP